MLKFKPNGKVILEDGLLHLECTFDKEQIIFLKKVEIEHELLLGRAVARGAHEYKTNIKKRLKSIVEGL